MKRRLSASIDEDVLARAEAAVREGRAPSLSALVEEALERQAEHELRMRALDEFVVEFEKEFGAFAPGEIEKLAAGARAKIRPASSVPHDRSRDAA